MRALRLLALCSILLLSFPLSHAHAHDESLCEGVLFLDAYVRPTVTPTGAVYGVLVNLTPDDVTVLGGLTEVAEAVEIHEMSMNDGVMSMNPLPDGLVIPAGEAVALEPGGYHIMLIGVKDIIAAGDTLELSLTLAGQDEPLLLSLPVQDPPEDEGMTMPMETEEPMVMGTEEAMGDMHAEDAEQPMMKGALAVAGCEDAQLDDLEWSLGEVDGMYMLTLQLEDAVMMLPVTSLVHGAMEMP